MIDTYETSFNHVTNYVVADTLSVRALTDHIKQGHLFIAFKALADAKEFMFFARDAGNNVSGILGDSIRVDEVSVLEATSPLPGQFRLIKDGEVVNTSPKNQYEFLLKDGIGKGVYRIEVYVTIDDKELPWVYTNPIFVY